MLWSRPSGPCAVGRRPNSLPKSTSVSSSRPRCSRSASSAAVGWSTDCERSIRPLCRLLWWSQPALADLDEAHAGLAQPAGHQALAGERSGRPGLHAVGVEHVLRLLRDVEQLGHLALHPEGQLVRLDDAVDRIGSARRCGEVAVHRLDQVELLALELMPPTRLEVRQIAGVVDARALEVGRQEGAAVVHRPAEVRRRVDGDVAGQVLVLRAEAVEQPRAHARPRQRGVGAAGVQLHDRLRVGRRVGVQAAEPAELVGVPGDVRQQFREPRAGLAVLLELELRRRQRPAAGADLPPFFCSSGL